MDESARKIVILGKTGVGKSSVANTIFGRELFKTNDTAKSETCKCQVETSPANGRSITLIDTPGFFDTFKSAKELKPEIVKCITECAPGTHAFLILLKVEKFTEHEEAVITQIREYFSEEVFKYATVLFTHGDQLDAGQTIKDFIQQNQHARDLLKKCGGRCHVIDNKHWKNNQQEEYRSNQFQVKEILKTIDEMVEANKGSCYTNEMLQAVEKQILKEEEELSESIETLTCKEVREQAGDGVCNNLYIKLKDFATGALLGALFGKEHLVEKVIKAMASGGVAAVAPAAAARAPYIIERALRGRVDKLKAADSPPKALKRAGPPLRTPRGDLRRKCHKPVMSCDSKEKK